MSLGAVKKGVAELPQDVNLVRKARLEKANKSLFTVQEAYHSVSQEVSQILLTCLEIMPERFEGMKIVGVVRRTKARSLERRSLSRRVCSDFLRSQTVVSTRMLQRYEKANEFIKSRTLSSKNRFFARWNKSNVSRLRGRDMY